jgi:peptidoglycan-associated lipoprotein
MRTLTKAASLAVLLLAVACSTNKSKQDTSGTDSAGTSGSSSSPYKGPATGSAGPSVVGKPTATGAGAAGGAMPAKHTLYFDFDKAELTADAQGIAETWAAYLSANPTAKVRLEGHTDERGTREYNVALGERRGNSVLQALTARGVSERQLSVTSFGEERPVALGHDESAWSQNRRVEIVP